MVNISWKWGLLGLIEQNACIEWENIQSITKYKSILALKLLGKWLIKRQGNILINRRKKIFDGIALLSGGAYAQYVTVPKTHVMELPKKLNYI